jgi:hypothetical protein
MLQLDEQQPVEQSASDHSSQHSEISIQMRQVFFWQRAMSNWQLALALGNDLLATS